MPGKLYLIPNAISDDGALEKIPTYIAGIAASLRYFFVEEEKSARRLLKKLNPQMPISECVFFLLNEHTSSAQSQACLKNLGDQDAGIMSESGCPCVADPGADVVLLAHQKGMEVIPLVGPSSILLALMASGLNGQNFAFNGYQPKERNLRIKKIKELEARSLKEGQTQIFMDTPYRNQNVFEDALSSLSAQTLFCLVYDLTGSKQCIKTMTIKQWQGQNHKLEKRPALFLIENRSKNLNH